MKVKVALERKAPARAVVPRLSRFLADEIAQGVVAVYEDELVSVVHHSRRRPVRLGQRRGRPAPRADVARVAQALNGVPGPVVDHRAHRQQADPHRALPVQLGALDRAARSR